MCHFVTLIVPTHDAEAVAAVMNRHGRAATPVDNPSIRKVLREGERQYLTTRGHCDCGTVLAPRHDTIGAFEEKLAREAARWRKKGWSEAKIARAIEDRRKADARPDGGGCDGTELWSAVLRDLGAELELPCAGLFVGWYSGAIDSEAFDAVRREVPGKFSQKALGSIERDAVTIFALS